MVNIAGKRVPLLTALIYLYFITQALLMSATGVLVPEIAASLHMSLAQIGLLGSLTAAGALAANLTSSLIADRAGKGALLSLSAGAGGLGTVAAALVPGAAWFLALGAMRGGSYGMYNTVGNAMMADLHPQRRGLFVGLLHALFGVGSLLGPLLASWALLSGKTWSELYLWLAVSQVIIAVLMFMLVKGGRTKPQDRPAQAVPARGLTRVLLPVCLGMGFYTVSQTTMVTWLPTFLQQEGGLGAPAASAALSVFWLGMVGGRLATMWLSDRFDGRTVLLIMSGAGGLFTLLATLLTQGPALFTSALLAGLFAGGIWPQSLAYMYGLFPGATGRITGAITVSTGVAGILLPSVTGAVAEYVSLRGAVQTSGLYLAIALVAFLILPTQGSQRREHVA